MRNKFTVLGWQDGVQGLHGLPCAPPPMCCWGNEENTDLRPTGRDVRRNSAKQLSLEPQMFKNLPFDKET